MTEHGHSLVATALRRSRTLTIHVCFGLSVLVPWRIERFQSPAPHKMPLGVAEQGSLILKVVSSDDDLRRRREQLRLAIVFLASVSESVAVKDELATSLPATKVGGRTLQALPMAMTSADDLDRTMARENIDILYVTPGLDSVLDDVLAISKRHAILSVTGVPEYVDKGVTVGFVGERRFLQVAINLKSARSESRRFDTSFLDKVKTR